MALEKITREIIEEIIISRNTKTDGLYSNAVSIGYRDLDNALGGFRRGETYLLAARPKMGKTALALNIIKNIAKNGNGRVAYFTLDMSREVLVDRLVQLAAGIEVKTYATNLKIPEDKANEIGSMIDKAEIYIDDLPLITTREIDSFLYEMGDGIDLVVIDAFQMLGDSEEVYRALDNLKRCAYFHNCPILILTSITKEPELRDDHRPRINDLQYPKAVRHVDNVMFLHRDDFYDKDSENKGIAEISIPRNKHRVAEIVELAWIPELLLFVNIKGHRLAAISLEDMKVFYNDEFDYGQ